MRRTIARTLRTLAHMIDPKARRHYTRIRLEMGNRESQPETVDVTTIMKIRNIEGSQIGVVEDFSTQPKSQCETPTQIQPLSVTPDPKGISWQSGSAAIVTSQG